MTDQADLAKALAGFQEGLELFRESMARAVVDIQTRIALPQALSGGNEMSSVTIPKELRPSRLTLTPGSFLGYQGGGSDKVWASALIMVYPGTPAPLSQSGRTGGAVIGWVRAWGARGSSYQAKVDAYAYDPETGSSLGRRTYQLTEANTAGEKRGGGYKTLDDLAACRDLRARLYEAVRDWARGASGYGPAWLGMIDWQSWYRDGLILDTLAGPSAKIAWSPGPSRTDGEPYYNLPAITFTMPEAPRTLTGGLVEIKRETGTPEAWILPVSPGGDTFYDLTLGRLGVGQTVAYRTRPVQIDWESGTTSVGRWGPLLTLEGGAFQSGPGRLIVQDARYDRERQEVCVILECEGEGFGPIEGKLNRPETGGRALIIPGNHTTGSRVTVTDRVVGKVARSMVYQFRWRSGGLAGAPSPWQEVVVTIPASGQPGQAKPAQDGLDVVSMKRDSEKVKLILQLRPGYWQSITLKALGKATETHGMKTYTAPLSGQVIIDIPTKGIRPWDPLAYEAWAKGGSVSSAVTLIEVPALEDRQPAWPVPEIMSVAWNDQKGRVELQVRSLADEFPLDFVSLKIERQAPSRLTWVWEGIPSQTDQDLWLVTDTIDLSPGQGASYRLRFVDIGPGGTDGPWSELKGCIAPGLFDDLALPDIRPLVRRGRRLT